MAGSFQPWQGFNYSGYNGGYQPTPSYGSQGNPSPPATNKIFVVSAEDALSRYAQPNSVMFYIQQDESVAYEVFTDMQGKKAIKARQLTEFTPSPAESPVGDFVSRKEFDELKAAFDKFLTEKETQA